MSESYSNLYRYDSNGNILGVLKYDYNQIPTYVLNSSDFPVNEDHLIASKTYEYSTEWLDQLESYVTMDDVEHEFTYDAQGNPLIITNFDFRGITYNHADLTWFGRQLTSISIENEYNQVLATLSYSYNDQGFRTKKIITVGSVVETYVYELLSSTVYFEKYTNSSNASLNYELSYLLDTGNVIIGFVYNGDAYYYLKDIQGNILSVVDNTGAILVQYEYDAFGNLISIEYDDQDQIATFIALKNPYTYRGYRFDSEINMYYLNSRYYSPEMSRFISSDGLLGEIGDIQSKNMYSYCEQDPVNSIDPMGYKGIGKHWWNKTNFIGIILDVLIITIPLFISINAALKARAGIKLAAEAAAKELMVELANRSRKVILDTMKDVFTKAFLKFAPSLIPVAIGAVTGVVNIIFVIAGNSLGQCLAKGMDYIDGNVDGYIFA